jgi:hypothetical protein
MNLRALLALTALSALAFAARAEPPRDDDAPAQASPDACAVVTPVARYIGYGYYHVVSLKNGCSRPVSCEVWTDVDPQPHHTLRVAPGETAEVVVRRGSPARDFKADKKCKF